MHPNTHHPRGRGSPKMLGIDSPDCVGMPRYQVFCLTPKTKRDPRVFLNKFFYSIFFYFTQELTSIFKVHLPRGDKQFAQNLKVWEIQHFRLRISEYGVDTGGI